MGSPSTTSQNGKSKIFRLEWFHLQTSHSSSTLEGRKIKYHLFSHHSSYEQLIPCHLQDTLQDHPLSHHAPLTMQQTLDTLCAVFVHHQHKNHHIFSPSQPLKSTQEVNCVQQ